MQAAAEGVSCRLLQRGRVMQAAAQGACHASCCRAVCHASCHRGNVSCRLLQKGRVMQAAAEGACHAGCCRRGVWTHSPRKPFDVELAETSCTSAYSAPMEERTFLKEWN